ncbi:uncharacterized protein LOC110026388 [Phalaenopsis equestris]|uniref:uncharacterized protein LOC110026388 n=1 Tax=Phalaenopsis equestris TaxID=78828 RepID=UPI0009E4C7DB|nr:uncharacterized protein LOC110026388 [Phalaenopsis equestris]
MSKSAGGATAIQPPMATSQKSVAKKKRNSLSGCLKAPFRFLRRARDMYVKGLGGCAGAGGGARGGGFTAGVVALMPRARSRSAFGPSNRFSSSDDDFSDLVRASSKVREAAAAVVVTRTQSAPTIERIEEVEEEEVLERSQSCAVQPAAAAAGGRLIRR